MDILNYITNSKKSCVFDYLPAYFSLFFFDSFFLIERLSLYCPVIDASQKKYFVALLRL